MAIPWGSADTKGRMAPRSCSPLVPPLPWRPHQFHDYLSGSADLCSPMKTVFRIKSIDHCHHSGVPYLWGEKK
ncbi:hypothetical protein U9M48_005611 [Paspalum notatum var. saurae]|uniref:Uncharacterized protein n=1 Tax=Paspalum notatum var. saurae TaxID=547442 RepID=A0AAQ3PMR7_PASNO